jgi:hypothetical protein
MASIDDKPQLLTPGRMAQELGVPIYRVLHILATRDHIQHVARAGNIRLFTRETIAQVRRELNAQDARRSCRKEAAHA